MTEDRPSPGTLVAGITGELSTLVRSEIELAKAELRESAKRGAAGGILFAVAAGILLTVWLLLTFALVYVLMEVADLPGWASFLIISGVYILIAAILIGIGVLQFQKARGPERAKAELQRTRQIVESLPPNTPPDPEAVRRTPGSEAAEA